MITRPRSRIGLTVAEPLTAGRLRSTTVKAEEIESTVEIQSRAPVVKNALLHAGHTVKVFTSYGQTVFD